MHKQSRITKRHFFQRMVKWAWILLSVECLVFFILIYIFSAFYRPTEILSRKWNAFKFLYIFFIVGCIWISSVVCVEAIKKRLSLVFNALCKHCASYSKVHQSDAHILCIEWGNSSQLLPFFIQSKRNSNYTVNLMRPS